MGFAAVGFEQRIVLKTWYDPSGQFIPESGTSVEKEILIPEKNRKFAATRVLPVESSSGNKFQILKEGYLRYTTYQNLDCYG